MAILRTPDERFQNLPDFPYAPHYTTVLNNLRMHYLDEGDRADGAEAILCLHGEPSWCFLYRKMIRVLAPHHRVVAPDLIGFGRSDKLPAKDDYTFKMHRDSLAEFVQSLDLTGITLVCQDWGGLLGLTIATEMPNRFARLVIMNTGLPTGEQKPTDAFLRWRAFAEKSTSMDIGRLLQASTVSQLTDDVLAAYNAPYPDESYQAGALKFPLLVPISPDAEAAPYMRRAREVLHTWSKPVLVMFSDSDPITAGGDRWFRKHIPTAANEPEITIKGGGHFLQEDKGEEIAEQILAFIKRTPIDSPSQIHAK